MQLFPMNGIDGGGKGRWARGGGGCRKRGEMSQKGDVMNEEVWAVEDSVWD